MKNKTDFKFRVKFNLTKPVNGKRTIEQVVKEFPDLSRLSAFFRSADRKSMIISVKNVSVSWDGFDKTRSLNNPTLILYFLKPVYNYLKDRPEDTEKILGYNSMRRIEDCKTLIDFHNEDEENWVSFPFISYDSAEQFVNACKLLRKWAAILKRWKEGEITSRTVGKECETMGLCTFHSLYPGETSCDFYNERCKYYTLIHK